MAAKIQKECGVKPQLIDGDKGIFDVVVDGKLIFSKFQEDRFPEPEEIVSLIKS